MKCDFHDSDKMPNHVEIVRRKCQPKSWDGKNANHRNKSGQNANLWLALCPVGILSSWHFVRTPSGLRPATWFSFTQRPKISQVWPLGFRSQHGEKTIGPEQFKARELQDLKYSVWCFYGSICFYHFAEMAFYR